LLSPLVRQKVRAGIWALLESLREHGIARLLLGSASLLRGLVRWSRGDLYLALEDTSRIHRIVRIPLLSRPAEAIERRVVGATCRRSGAPRSVGENRLIDDFLRSRTARELFRGGMRSREHKIRMGGELLLLKEPDPATGELGVIILKYGQSFGRFVAVYDIERVLERYQIVLEPSWVGYRDPVFYLYFDRARHVVIQAHISEDFQTILDLHSNLVPVPFCSGNWVSDEHFHPLPGLEKDYLVVLVANWAPHKRHQLLLDALGRVEDRSARIALVGYPWKGYERERIEHEVRRRGLERRVDLYQRISRKEVNRVLNRSHANLLLSRKEGSSKIFYESLAAGTPCIVISDHEGIDPSHVNDRTGIRASANELAGALEMMRREGHTFDPHAWWRENASIPVTTAALEAVLREKALEEGRPWTRGLHPKKNDPNLAYLEEGLAEHLAPAYEELATLLREPELPYISDPPRSWWKELRRR
jgi:glycosyltransferase involved in cell wall biosynthesis